MIDYLKFKPIAYPKKELSDTKQTLLDLSQFKPLVRPERNPAPIPDLSLLNVSGRFRLNHNTAKSLGIDYVSESVYADMDADEKSQYRMNNKYWVRILTNKDMIIAALDAGRLDAEVEGIKDKAEKVNVLFKKFGAAAIELCNSNDTGAAKVGIDLQFSSAIAWYYLNGSCDQTVSFNISVDYLSEKPVCYIDLNSKTSVAVKKRVTNKKA